MFRVRLLTTLERGRNMGKGGLHRVLVEGYDSNDYEVVCCTYIRCSNRRKGDIISIPVQSSGSAVWEAAS